VRGVVDTNVLISAIFWTGKPKQILNKVRRGEILFLTSGPLLEELEGVLIEKDKPFKLAPEEAERIIIGMRELAEIIQTHTRVAACEDEKDNRVLECAIDGDAECIVTGDLHLLKLNPFKGIRIITVTDFLKYCEEAIHMGR
jgi:putative PIN family toxin of toxin-antitoxin system